MKYDFIIAGSGAAGSALTSRLAESGASVLLLEKGSTARAASDAMEAVYRYYTHSGFLSATGNCLLPIPTGTAVGGTTKINSGTCFKTPDDLLRRWERNGTGIFRREEFLPYLDAAWRRLHVSQAPQATASVSSNLFLQGLKKLSIAGGALLERAETNCVGSARCCFICPTDSKMSADKAFLEVIRDRPNFTLESSAELVHITPGSHTAGDVNIVYSQHGRLTTASAKTLILAAGTLSTPYFIRRFRLGPQWEKAGDNLSVHPAGKMFALFKEPIRGWNGVPQGAGVQDPMESRIRYEGVYTPPEIAAITLPLEGQKLRRWMDQYDRVATFGFMLKDLGRGSVRYPAGRRFPAIRYDLHEEDRRLLIRAMRFLGQIFFAAGALEVVLPFNRRDNIFDSKQSLEQTEFSDLPPASLQMMAFHPLGTAAMHSVVDENLRLCDGIYVCDGSVIPESLGVNPQITIYALALRLADHLIKTAHVC